jgi:hypothetical protein
MHVFWVRYEGVFVVSASLLYAHTMLLNLEDVIHACVFVKIGQSSGSGLNHLHDCGVNELKIIRK